MFTSGTQTARTLRWIVLLPALMVGSMLYWSVAIGLGGVSLMMASALSSSTDATFSVSTDTQPDPTAVDVVDGTNTITVHLEESEEPDDVNDNAGAAGFTVTDDQPAAAPGPGSTSY
jgi:uncharacterized glyoxalase superfamily protein PhnB